MTPDAALNPSSGGSDMCSAVFQLMDLFLGVRAKKTSGSRTPATVLLTLPPITLHWILYSDTVLVLCVVNRKALQDDTGLVWKHLLFERLRYCNELNRDWGCLCSDQQHIASVSVDEPWNSHRALSCCCFHWNIQFVTIKNSSICTLKEWSLLSFLLSLLAVTWWVHSVSRTL